MNFVKDIIKDPIDFLNTLDQQVEVLKQSSLLKGINLDFSEESIYKIDNIIVSDFVEQKITKSDIKNSSRNLMAYLGMMYIKKYGGKWEINTSSEKEFRVYINKDGKRIDFFTSSIETLVYFDEEELPNLGNGYFSIVNNPFFKNTKS